MPNNPQQQRHPQHNQQRPNIPQPSTGAASSVVPVIANEQSTAIELSKKVIEGEVLPEKSFVEPITFLALVANEVVSLALGLTSQRASLDNMRIWLASNPDYTIDEGNTVMQRMNGAVASLAQEFPKLMHHR